MKNIIMMDPDHSFDTSKGMKEESDLQGSPPVHLEIIGEMSERERQIHADGVRKFNRLGWKHLTVVLIVEAIALAACQYLPRLLPWEWSLVLYVVLVSES